MQLAKLKAVDITYEVKGVKEFQSDEKFDAIGLCYAHFPIDIPKQANQYLLNFLKPKEIVIFEAFSKAQLRNTSGGSKNKEMLFSIEEIKGEFPQLKFEILKKETLKLSEGNYHKGKAEVIRFVGVKS